MFRDASHPRPAGCAVGLFLLPYILLGKEIILFDGAATKGLLYLTAMQEIKQEQPSNDKESTTYELLSSDELEAQIFKEEPK